MTDKALIRKVRELGSDWLGEQVVRLGNHEREVETRTPGIFYARQKNGEVITVWNTLFVSPDFDKRVIVRNSRQQPKIWRISESLEDYDSPSSAGRIGPHREQHEENGFDRLTLDRKQIKQLSVRAAGGYTVRVYGGDVQTASGLVRIPNTPLNLEAHLPGEGDGARYVSIEAGDDGTISDNPGDLFEAPNLGTASDIPAPAPGSYTIAYVLMYEGQVKIIDANIRPIMPLPGAGSSGGGGDVTLEDLTSQIDGTADHFSLSAAADSLLLFYNGVFQPATHFTMDGDDLGFTLDFVPDLGDSLVAVYGISGVVTLTDPNAIHSNQSSEFTGLTEKTALVADDLILIEDSEDSGNKKKVKASNLGGGSGGWELILDEDGTSFANFTSASGSWSSTGAHIQQTSSDSNLRKARYNTKIPHAGLIYEAEVQAKNNTSDAQVSLLVGYDGGTGSGGISINIMPNENVVRIDRDVIAAVASYSVTIDIDIWYTLRALIFGNVVSVFLDGTLLGTCRVTLTEADASFIGLRSINTGAWFRNIRAWVMSQPA